MNPDSPQNIACEAGPSQCDCGTTEPIEDIPVVGKTIGQIAYEAYAEHTEWKSLATGCRLPAWSLLNPAIKEAWEVTAHKVQSVSPRTSKPILPEVMPGSTLREAENLKMERAQQEARKILKEIDFIHRIQSSLRDLFESLARYQPSEERDLAMRNIRYAISRLDLDLKRMGCNP